MPTRIGIGVQIPRRTAGSSAAPVNGSYFGRRYFGARYFGKRYFG